MQPTAPEGPMDFVAGLSLQASFETAKTLMTWRLVINYKTLTFSLDLLPASSYNLN